MSDPVIQQLTGPGGAFEIVIEDVVGVPTQVYKQRMRSLRELMEQNASRADQEWLVQGDQRYTFGEHDRLARIVAGNLAALGVEHGDRVALCSANDPAWVITWWACALLGAVVVPLNAWWKTEELDFGIKDSGSKVLIADTRRLALVAERPEQTFEIGGSFNYLLEGDDPGIPTTPVDEDDLLAIHVTGCLATMMLIYATGAKLVLMPVGRFDSDLAMQIIERERITSIGGVPTIMWRMLESPNLDQYDLSSVKRASYGGAPAARELVERIEKVFPNLRKTLSTAYGLTETASVATAHGGEDYFAHPGSVGRAVPTVEVRVVDDAGNDAPTGERGEVWIKGPTVMARGYWQRPDANAAALSDGWFHTGDIGYLDADGLLYLVDRAKDMIIRGGENIYSVEVEQTLFDHPDVVDAAVVGVPHRTLGEEVKAVVQLRPGSSATEDEIRAFCAQHLADFKVPAYVDVRSEPLPRNPAGKVLKNLLRGQETSFAAADDQAL